jgi:methionyl-tRNA formyltransferase
VARLRNINADVFVVVSFGQLLSREVLALPRRCCLNLHASLLPRWRGAAPINWALLSHDEMTGVSVMRMNERMDAGDILLSRSLRIRLDHDALSLGHELAQLGAAALEEGLEQIRQGRETYTPQDASLATSARKLRKEDGAVDWQEPAEHIHDQVRGLVPWPSAYTRCNRVFLKIHRAALADGVAVPEACTAGTILKVEKARGMLVATGRGCLAVCEVQPEGGRRMSAYDFALGHRLESGARLG